MNHRRLQAEQVCHKKNQAGFTLIELLVVVAIIGLLSSIVTVSVTSARNQARDTQRMQDMHRLEIEGGLSILDRRPIPVSQSQVSIDDIGKSDELAHAIDSQGNNDGVFEAVAKYVGVIPEDVFAQSTPLGQVHNDNFKALFSNANSTNQPFFRPGISIPEDPQCTPTNSSTCYRAWYDGQTLIIATTLRTRRHTSGKLLQYGVIIGQNTDAALRSACQAMGYPRYNTTANVVVGPSNAACVGTSPVSAIKGITSGLQVTGGDSGVGYGDF